jgi:hypothetical protein
VFVCGAALPGKHLTPKCGAIHRRACHGDSYFRGPDTHAAGTKYGAIFLHQDSRVMALPYLRPRHRGDEQCRDEATVPKDCVSRHREAVGTNIVKGVCLGSGLVPVGSVGRAQLIVLPLKLTKVLDMKPWTKITAAAIAAPLCVMAPSAAVASDSSWVAPVAGDYARIAGFGPLGYPDPPIPGSPRMFHYGYDFGQECGAPVYAAFDGTVDYLIAETGTPQVPMPSPELGYRIRIEHFDRASVNSLSTLYARLLPGSITVKKGDRVSAGQLIGRIGESGGGITEMPGCALHFEVLSDKLAISPEIFFAALGIPLK